MTKSSGMARAGSLREFREFKAAGRDVYTPQELQHIYVKLHFTDEFENARTAEQAKSFLRSVTRAAMACHGLAEEYDGVLLEVQGSMLHIAVPERSGPTMDGALGYVADLHIALGVLFHDRQKRVQAWRMTIDTGKTLIVAGRGVHGDDSWVSLGRAANAPAKHLYAQLELPEEDRALKAFHVGIHVPQTGNWRHEHLDARLRSPLASTIAEKVRRAEPRLHYAAGSVSSLRVQADAARIAPAGSPGSPTAERPQAYFGWVLRTDLDGFSARVDACIDNDDELCALAEQFHLIMDAGAAFVHRNRETLAQLPWAGDNFTVAAVFQSKNDYDSAIPSRLVELSLDFEKEMAEIATNCGFGGWAHGTAGGTVHGNAEGNVFLCGIEAGGRRFLVGAGEGFGRSTQAFGDVDPKASDLVAYAPDWARLDQNYKRVFEPAVTRRKQQSSLYCHAKIQSLWKARAAEASKIVPSVVVTTPQGRKRDIAVRPYFP